MVKIMGMLLGLLHLMVLAASNSAYDRYFADAGRAFGIDPQLLRRIAQIESGMDAQAINRNTNGTVDYGVMQINSIHLKKLGRLGITQEALMDPEINIHIAAMLLSAHIRKKGYNLDAIGMYHSANPKHKRRWLARLAGVSRQQLWSQSDDNPRAVFIQREMDRRTREKIASGADWREAQRLAQAEINRLLWQ